MMFRIWAVYVGMVLVRGVVSKPDYRDALMKSILFFEGQRSGALNLSALRNGWRADSGMRDGLEQGVNLVGGYYDAGDNVKFHFPLSFTMTLLAWGVIEYGAHLDQAGQLEFAKEALRWGTDYLMQCHTSPYEFWGQVGVGSDDHSCWERPEDMTTLRTAFRINDKNPGSELAAEAAAALAAASKVYSSDNVTRSEELLRHSQELFILATQYQGSYTNSIPDAQPFYSSFSGYHDELGWAAAWLYTVTENSTFLNFIIENDSWLQTASTSMSEFSWDNKYAGTQILLSRVLFRGLFETEFQRNVLERIKTRADYYVCSNLPGNILTTVKTTPEGLLFIRKPNLQYVVNFAFLSFVYSDNLSFNKSNLNCQSRVYTPIEIQNFSKTQIDYILGVNDASMSYMVGFGQKFPKKIHHRGASIISIRSDPNPVGCKEGYAIWYSSTDDNPNVHFGAIVGGPDENDVYVDDRAKYDIAEPTTYTNAAAMGALAKIVGLASSAPPSYSPPPSISPPFLSPPPLLQSPPPPSSPFTYPVPFPPPSPLFQSPPPPSPPPPPQDSFSPLPTSAFDLITIRQAVAKIQPIPPLVIFQFNVTISYNGGGRISNLTLVSPNFNPLSYWALNCEVAPMGRCTLPYASPPISSDQPYRAFGYERFGGPLTFQLLNFIWMA